MISNCPTTSFFLFRLVPVASSYGAHWQCYVMMSHVMTCWQVGLTVLQYLVWVVQSQLAASAAGPGVPPGPAEAVLAKKLFDLVKAIAASDSAGGTLQVLQTLL
jgi:hypothetical protein